MSKDNKKNQPNQKTYSKELFEYIKPFLPAVVIALLFSIVGSILTVIVPDQISKITNLIAEGLHANMNLDRIGKIAIVLLTINIIALVLNYIESFIMTTVTQMLSKDLRGAISEKINKLPLGYFHSTSHGDILSRVTNDVDTISDSLSRTTSAIASSATMLIGSLLMMFFTNAVLTVTAITSSVLGFLVIRLITSRSQKYFIRQQNELGEINGHIEEMYSGHQVIKVYNAGRESKKVFTDVNIRLYESEWKSQFMSGLMMPIMFFFGNIGYVAVCIVGAMMAKQGLITFGIIVAFMIYVRMFTQPLSQIAQIITNLQSTAAASNRVFEFLDGKELLDESNKTIVLKPEDVKGDIDFKNIKFGYTKDRSIIHDFSIDIKAGQTVAIVGPTGAGKTTIVNLLMRFYELDSGEITIDGIPISSLTRENVHDLFCMVLQDTWVFEGTVKENIIFNKEDVSDEDVLRASKAVGVDHFIKTLPKGYETVLDDKTNLSEGQKQLITITRAMVDNSPLLILDEATSSVDTRTEILIQKAMSKLMAGRTSFIIAHRLSTIRDSDIILVMKDGNIIESGTHDALLKENGFYAELYNSQFEDIA